MDLHMIFADQVYPWGCDSRRSHPAWRICVRKPVKRRPKLGNEPPSKEHA